MHRKHTPMLVAPKKLENHSEVGDIGLKTLALAWVYFIVLPDEELQLYVFQCLHLTSYRDAPWPRGYGTWLLTLSMLRLFSSKVQKRKNL